MGRREGSKLLRRCGRNRRKSLGEEANSTSIPPGSIAAILRSSEAGCNRGPPVLQKRLGRRRKVANKQTNKQTTSQNHRWYWANGHARATGLIHDFNRWQKI